VQKGQGLVGAHLLQEVVDEPVAEGLRVVGGHGHSLTPFDRKMHVVSSATSSNRTLEVWVVAHEVPVLLHEEARLLVRQAVHAAVDAGQVQLALEVLELPKP
jgi:hypothetical protein